MHPLGPVQDLRVVRERRDEDPLRPRADREACGAEVGDRFRPVDRERRDDPGVGHHQEASRGHAAHPGDALGGAPLVDAVEVVQYRCDSNWFWPSRRLC